MKTETTNNKLLRFTFYDLTGNVADIVECEGFYGHHAKWVRRMFENYKEIYSALYVGERLWLKGNRSNP